jgi:hypothetical protein
MPAPAHELAQTLLHGPHPRLPLSQARFGLSAQAVRESGRQPVVALGMVDATGRNGRIGGGIWTVPTELFFPALDAMAVAT